VQEEVPEGVETYTVECDLALMIGGYVDAGEEVIRCQPWFKNAILQNLMAEKERIVLHGSSVVQIIADFERFVAGEGAAVGASRESVHRD
jgi:hypothetical protein